MASQRSPLGSTIFAELQQAASSSHSCDSDQNLLFDILTLTHFIGPCINEYAQTTQDKVNYHVYPSRTRFIKAFTATDFIFYDKNGHVLTKIDDSSLDLATSVQITEEPSKRPEDQTFCGYEEPCNIPHLGSTASGHESPPSCTAGLHAGRLLQNQESPVAIHHWQQDCYTPSQGSKESAFIYFS